jgi:tol-pal system protein YbgF
MRVVLLPILLVGLILAGCVGIEPIKTDLNEVKYDNYELTKRVTSLQAELDRMKNDPERDKALASIKESQADIMSQLSSLQSEIQSVRGDLEEEKHFTGNALEESSKGSVEYKKQFDEKIAILAKDVSAQEQRITELETAMKNASAPKPEPLTPEKEYQAAYDLFTAEKYPESRKAFEDFVAKNSSHELAGNSQFWIGESYFREKDFSAAILAYEEVLKKYAGNRKVPAALYKQGLAFLEMKDKKVATAILNELVEKYPESDEAAQAKAKLAELSPPQQQISEKGEKPEKPAANAKPAPKRTRRR